MTVNDTDDRFYFNIHKMELERIKFMLKSYLRTRIFKIERHLIYLIEEDLAHLMSEAEMSYAWKIYEQKQKLFDKQFFSVLPKQLDPFNDTYHEGLDKKMSKLFHSFCLILIMTIVTKPNDMEFVFIRVRDARESTWNLE